jgi:hypothetical protein
MTPLDLNLQLSSSFVRQFLGGPICMRLAFWTLAMAYTSVLLIRSTGGSSPGNMFTAALLGAVIGFSLGGIFINRRTRKRG